MTDEQAYESIKSFGIVYWVSCLQGRFFTDCGKIVGLILEPGAPICYDCESDITRNRRGLYAYHLYDNREEADIECANEQEEHGHVVITQKEYNEYRALKEALQIPSIANTIFKKMNDIGGDENGMDQSK